MKFNFSRTLAQARSQNTDIFLHLAETHFRCQLHVRHIVFQPQDIFKLQFYDLHEIMQQSRSFVLGTAGLCVGQLEQRLQSEAGCISTCTTIHIISERQDELEELSKTTTSRHFARCFHHTCDAWQKIIQRDTEAFLVVKTAESLLIVMDP